jgi:hypothetical protein
MLDSRLHYSYCALRIAFGASAFASGLYTLQTSGLIPRISGAIQLGAGVLVFTPLTGVAARVLTSWLLLIALKLLLAGGPYETAACDVVLAAGAFALARFTTVNEAPSEPRPARDRSAGTGVEAHRIPMSVCRLQRSIAKADARSDARGRGTAPSPSPPDATV